MRRKRSRSRRMRTTTTRKRKRKMREGCVRLTSKDMKQRLPSHASDRIHVGTYHSRVAAHAAR
eukprot:2926334-Rhodomonas_salina.1